MKDIFLLILVLQDTCFAELVNSITYKMMISSLQLMVYKKLLYNKLLFGKMFFAFQRYNKRNNDLLAIVYYLQKHF